MSWLSGVLADTRPLKQPDYRRLWGAHLITMIGAQLTVVAVPAQIYSITESSAYVGLTGAFGLVPLVIFGLYGGALADAFDRRTVLIVSTLGIFTTSALFWLQALLGNQNVWLLLGLFSIQQAFFGVNFPTRSAIIPRLLPAHLLPAANSLWMTVSMAGGLAGPLLAGVLIPFTGLAWLYFIDTVVLCVTVWAAYRLPPMPVTKSVGSAPGVAAVIDGLRYLRTQPILLMSFVVDLIAMVFGMARALIPEIAHADFGGPVEGGMIFALLFASMPAGAVLGGLFSGWVSRIERHGLAVILSVLVWGASMLGFGVAVMFADRWPTAMLVTALLMMVIGGAADIVSAAFRTSMLQSATTDEMMGRLQGVFVVVVAGGPRVADVAHGAAAANVGAATAAAGGGALVIVGTVLAALLVPAFVRYRVTSSN